MPCSSGSTTSTEPRSRGTEPGLRTCNAEPEGPPRDTISPSLTDGNSWAVSVGAGYEVIPGLRADVGYQFAFFDTLHAEGANAFPGTYDTHVHLLSIGATYRLPDL